MSALLAGGNAKWGNTLPGREVSIGNAFNITPETIITKGNEKLSF